MVNLPTGEGRLCPLAKAFVAHGADLGVVSPADFEGGVLSDLEHDDKEALRTRVDAFNLENPERILQKHAGETTPLLNGRKTMKQRISSISKWSRHFSGRDRGEKHSQIS